MECSKRELSSPDLSSLLSATTEHPLPVNSADASLRWGVTVFKEIERISINPQMRPTSY